ncbi:MAG: DUF2589 domain-containing protein [Candidatus Accumulibacter sp.]|jgi:hypothetical protein|nr:DUF2589 domain-containing protein [Accumulibacter sp.]
MSPTSSLHGLVMAISNAVLRAQEKVEAAQLNNLMSYFYRKSGHKGFFPLSMRVNLPSLRPEAEPGETDVYRVPYLSALPHSALRIKQVEVNFDVAFGDLAVPEKTDAGNLHPGEQEGKPLQGSGEFPDLVVDMGAFKKGQNVMAHVKLTMEGVDLPEGTARLINELIKTNQMYESSPGVTPTKENGA